MLIVCFQQKAGAKVLIFNEKMAPVSGKDGAIYVYLTVIRSSTAGIPRSSGSESACRVWCSWPLSGSFRQ